MRRLGATHQRHTRALLAALWLALPASGEPRADQAPATLEALMKGMAGAPGVVARFRERKELALLSLPMESTGVLYFVPPNRLSRETNAPSVTRLVIDGDRFFFRDAAGSQSIDLAASPIARAYVDNFIVLFNGDLAELRRRYEPTFRADAKGWQLELRPRGQLADFIERVTLVGHGRILDRMELVEAGGDRTTTWFEGVRNDRAFTAEELTRIFSEPSAPKQ